MNTYPQRAYFCSQSFQPKVAIFPPKLTRSNEGVISQKLNNFQNLRGFFSFKPLTKAEDKLSCSLIDKTY